MQLQEISQADLLDILFEGRNKDYGAYDLRKTYNRRLARALAITASICLALAGGYTLAGGSRQADARMMVIDDSVMLSAAARDQPIAPPPVPRPHLQVATIQSTTIRIVPDQQVRPQDVPPPSDIPDEVKIGTATHAGELSGDIIEAPVGNGTAAGNVIEQPKHPGEDTRIYNIVEIESTYPGGIESWKRFLIKNFRITDEVSGTVIVRFIVDKEGNVSDVEAISGPDELRAEAVRVIRKSGKWTPAIQNGRKVNSYKQQPIVVRLE